MPAILMNNRENHKPRFFLTRQSANLLLDLDRQLATAGSLVLLYGRSGTGKTALLEYFCRHRLATRRVWFVRFDELGAIFHLDGDKAEYSTHRFQPVVLDRVEKGDLLVVDNLELADEALLSSLLRFVAQDATPRDVRVVLVAHNNALAGLQRRALPLGLEIPAVELKPLDPHEAKQFVSELLCPENQTALVLNSAQRRMLKSAQGSFAALTQLSRELDADVNCTAASSRGRPGRAFSNAALVVLVLLVAAAMLAGGWHDSLFNRMAQVPPQTEPVVELEKTKVETRTAIAAPAVSNVDDPVVLEENEQPGQDIAGIDLTEPARELVADTTASAVAAPAPGRAVSIDRPGSAQSRQGRGDSPAQIVADGPVQPLVAEAYPMLRSSLAATLRWLQQAAESSTSIQIMTLLFRDNSEQSLESFFLRLQRQGVDLQNIMVYRVVRANSMAYVVLYGSYPDRPAATDAIRGLPETLKDNRPIVRTLIGVRSDIEDSLK